MNTPSHVIIAAALRRAAKRVDVPLVPVLLGSIAPDVPLVALTLGGSVYYCGILGWPLREALRWMLGTLYLENRWWLAARSLLHAPLVIGVLLAAGWLTRRTPSGRWLGWFAAACGLHAVLDILTHATDGPLLLFPFDWRIRFHSPVSYWDPAHYGHIFRWAEIAADLALLWYLAADWRSRRRPPESP